MTSFKLKTISVPPDGGWGWVICFAYALSNILIIPIMQSFGLTFNNKFEALGLSATEIAIIINVNSSFGMLMGLINGSFLKQFGYRKVALAGGIVVSLGVIATAFANSFLYFLIFYGIIASFGFGLSFSAFSLALNSFFKKRRGIATGFAMTGTGLGPIIMPLWISYLLGEYGTTGCVLIIGATSLNTIVASLLLQPLKWHMKQEIPDQELQLLDENKNGGKADEKDSRTDIFNSTLSIDHDVETKSIYGFETPIPRRKASLSSLYDTNKVRKRSYSRSISQPQPLKQSSLSINTISSLKSITEENDLLAIDETEHTQKMSLFSRIAIIFDLDLLKDPIFLNLMFGLSFAVYAEINFSLLTPFILSDYHFKTFEVATIMSTIAFADIVFRFCAPFIASWLKVTPKLMYSISLVMLISSRTALIFVESYIHVIIVAIALGIAKGFRTVFMSLLIPSYVPIEKLASASGLQMVANGIFNMIGGPILGVIRDVTGSYHKCIMVMNGITTLTLIMWATEYLYFRFLKNRKI